MGKKAKAKRPKHVPQRTCVGCHEIQAKRTLIRVVRTDTGIVIDPTSKLAGRGAYIHNLNSCWQAAIKGKLAGALKTEITDQEREMLINYMKGLPEQTEKEEHIGSTL